uniref:hypothetical protein n=1 Tax=Ningiella ruwaisensis TaxID=2364274 RepID=UPI0010A034C4|nr:hypothetical protein [Ningiella ruwaisensis]
MTLHQVIYETPIGKNLHAVIDEKSDGKYIFRVLRHNNKKDDVLAVANVSEHEQFSEFECYTEAVKLDEGLTLESFRPCYEFLEFHVTWFKRAIDKSAKLIPYVINAEYVDRVYGSRKNLMKSMRLK